MVVWHREMHPVIIFGNVSLNVDGVQNSLRISRRTRVMNFDWLQFWVLFFVIILIHIFVTFSCFNTRFKPRNKFNSRTNALSTTWPEKFGLPRGVVFWLASYSWIQWSRVWFSTVSLSFQNIFPLINRYWANLGLDKNKERQEKKSVKSWTLH